MAAMTITTDAAQALRFATAVGKAMGLGRDATAPECKAFTITMMRELVQRQEYITAQNQITNTAFDPT